MKLNSRLLKSLNSIAISAGLLGLVSYVNPAKAETPALCKDKLTQTTAKKNIFSENNSATATALASSNYYCLGSPDRFELVIYEMGLCTSNPISGTPKAFSKDNCITTMTSTGTTADLAGKTVNLPSASTRPANATYTHAYMTILNEFGLKGSISLAGTVYYSNSTGGVSTNSADLSNHTEELDSFDDSFDADFGPETMPTGGKVSALLTDSSLTRAANASAVTRLVAVFETNSGSPVVISDSVNGVEVELQVADGGYGIMFNNSGVPEDFGSAPFKPVFTTF
tara:strand:- start:65 stop:913 length:849 start_codon:yes stop_codon:yes gene_type:complete